MGEIPLHEVILQYNGLYDFDGMYAALVDWAKHYGYLWHEVYYKHKVPDQGAEQEMQWDMSKKVTDFIHFTISIKAHVWDLYEVEVTAEGKKKPLSNARITLNINGIMTYDWQKRFQGSKFLVKMGKWYYKLLKKDIESIYIDMLYYRIWNLHAVLKKYFDMQTKAYAYKGYLKEH